MLLVLIVSHFGSQSINFNWIICNVHSKSCLFPHTQSTDSRVFYRIEIRPFENRLWSNFKNLGPLFSSFLFTSYAPPQISAKFHIWLKETSRGIVAFRAEFLVWDFLTPTNQCRLTVQAKVPQWFHILWRRVVHNSSLRFLRCLRMS